MLGLEMIPSPAASRPERAPPVVVVSLAVLCAVALAVRLWGVAYLLPLVKLGDSSFVVKQVEMLRSSAPADYADPAINCYPLLLSRTVALFPDRSGVGDGETLDLAEHLRRAGARWREIRIASVLYSLFLVPGTWWLARRFVGDAWALLAAAFCATSLLHVDFSAQEPPHALVTSTILLAVLAALRLRRRGDVASYLLAGVASGLAVGSLQSGACVLPAIATAVILRERREDAASRWWILATLAIVALFVRWLYPFHFVSGPSDPALVDREGQSLFMLSGHEVLLDEFNGLGFSNTLHALSCYDPILVGAAVLGLVCFAIRLRGATDSARDGDPPRRTHSLRASLLAAWSDVQSWSPREKDVLVVCAQAVPYYFVIGAYSQNFERFAMPLLPALACAGAYGVRATVEAIARRMSLGRAARIALGASLPAIAAIPAVGLARLRAAPSTQCLAAEWIERNVHAGERIVVVPHMDLPLLADETALDENRRTPKRSDWLSYQARLRPEQRVGASFDFELVPGTGADGAQLLQTDPMAYFAAHGARYVVLGLSSAQAVAVERARSALRANARCVLRLSPERTDSGGSVAVTLRHPDPEAASAIFERPYAFWLFEMERMGRSIEIYRLD
jgi:hypothetical protein